MVFETHNHFHLYLRGRLKKREGEDMQQKVEVRGTSLINHQHHLGSSVLFESWVLDQF